MNLEKYSYVFPNGTEVREDDEVVITGVSSSPAGKSYVDLRGIVATVDKTDSICYLKLWPHKHQEQLTEEEYYEGKIWFPSDLITDIKVVSRGILWEREGEYGILD